MRTSIFRVTGSVASIVSFLVLFGGVASAQTTATINDTGRDSTNIIEINERCEITINNENNIVIVNSTNQGAVSGDTTVADNDDVEGDAASGDASNSNDTSFNVVIDNRANITCFLKNETVAPTAPVGGGSGGGAAPVTPVAAPAVTPAASVAPASFGGRGGGDSETWSTPVAQQVATVPVGSVDAGGGGQAYLGGLTAVTLLSGAYAARRLQRSLKTQF